MKAIEDEHQSRMDSLMISMKEEHKQKMLRNYLKNDYKKYKINKDRVRNEYPKALLVIDDPLKKYENIEIDKYGNAVPKPKFMMPGFNSVKNAEKAYQDYMQNLGNLQHKI